MNEDISNTMNVEHLIVDYTLLDFMRSFYKVFAEKTKWMEIDQRCKIYTHLYEYL